MKRLKPHASHQSAQYAQSNRPKQSQTVPNRPKQSQRVSKSLKQTPETDPISPKQFHTVPNGPKQSPETDPTRPNQTQPDPTRPKTTAKAGSVGVRRRCVRWTPSCPLPTTSTPNSETLPPPKTITPAAPFPTTLHVSITISDPCQRAESRR